MKKNKFYAVVNGNIPGIYTTWYDCEEQVKNFKGARFKSFRTKEQALKYLADEGISLSTQEHEETSNVDLHTVIRWDRPNIYVAGDYSNAHSLYLWSYVDTSNSEYFKSGIGNNEKYLHSEEIAGEAIAILQAVDYCIAKGYTKIALIVSSIQFKDWVMDLSFCISEISKSFYYLMAKKIPEIDIVFIVQESWNDKDVIKKLKVRTRSKQLD